MTSSRTKISHWDRPPTQYFPKPDGRLTPTPPAQRKSKGKHPLTPRPASPPAVHKKAKPARPAARPAFSTQQLNRVRPFAQHWLNRTRATRVIAANPELNETGFDDIISLEPITVADFRRNRVITPKCCGKPMLKETVKEWIKTNPKNKCPHCNDPKKIFEKQLVQLGIIGDDDENPIFSSITHRNDTLFQELLSAKTTHQTHTVPMPISQVRRKKDGKLIYTLRSPQKRILREHGKKKLHEQPRFSETDRQGLSTKTTYRTQPTYQVNATTRFRETPLHAAAKHGTPDMVKALLARGANPHLLSARGQSVFHLLIENQHAKELIKIFIKAGVDPNAPNQNQSTPLSSAIEFGYYDVAKALLPYTKKSINKTDDQKLSPIIYAVLPPKKTIQERRISLDQQKNMIRLLAHYKANINSENGPDKYTPLLLAIYHKELEIIKLLLQLPGLSKTKKNIWGTPRELAESRQIARLLPNL